MSTEIQAPFGLAPDGGIAVITDANEQTSQHIEALCATGPGERVVLCSYGVAMRNAVFAPSDQVISQVLLNNVTAAMQTWESSVQVLSVNVAAAEGVPSNSATVTINWTPKAPQNPANPGIFTATVLVGGQVI